jgi:hypothetical protein
LKSSQTRRRTRKQAGRLSYCGHSVLEGGGSDIDLLDLEYLDAMVGPLPKLDGDVRRYEGAADLTSCCFWSIMWLSRSSHTPQTQHQMRFVGAGPEVSSIDESTLCPVSSIK